MNFLIISGNPKTTGLCHEITMAACNGAAAGGVNCQIEYTNDIGRCKMCGDGWGVCRNENKCAFGGDDGFDELHNKIKNADAISFITPVYWWDVSEGLKSFLDRLRRCEFGQEGALSGKPVLLIASPGGSGNGLVNCFEQMELFCRHTGASVFDFIGVNRWNKDYKAVCAFEAAKALASGRKVGDDV